MELLSTLLCLKRERKDRERKVEIRAKGEGKKSEKRVKGERKQSAKGERKES
jgi:hypothetical protein